jgi:probable phosphoglycerate mutase
MLLYIVRHGDPIYETDSLTERGFLQAESVAKRMKDAKIDRVFSSPLGRAIKTAEPTCRLLGLECNIEEWSQEVDDEHLFTPFPDGVMKSVNSVQNTYYRENGLLELGYDDTYSCVGINQSKIKEKAKIIEAGGFEFLERLGYKYENGVFRIIKPNEERIALFCHGAMTRVWMSVLFHIPYHIVSASFSPTHTGVTVLEFKNNSNGVTAPKCLCFSDMSHLYADRLDMKHNNKTVL